jgi:hypothetical protein
MSRHAFTNLIADAMRTWLDPVYQRHPQGKHTNELLVISLCVDSVDRNNLRGVCHQFFMLYVDIVEDFPHVKDCVRCFQQISMTVSTRQPKSGAGSMPHSRPQFRLLCGCLCSCVIDDLSDVMDRLLNKYITPLRLHPHQCAFPAGQKLLTVRFSRSHHIVITTKSNGGIGQSVKVRRTSDTHFGIMGVISGTTFCYINHITFHSV